MQAFEFTITYERGADELMDVFIENPGLYSKTISCNVSGGTMWRLDEVTGPRESLLAYDDVLEGLHRCTNLEGVGGCPIDWSHEVLVETANRRIIYSKQSEGPGCRSIPYLVREYLGDGALFRAEQYHDTYKWRVLVENDASLSPIYETIDAHLRPGLELRFERVDHSPEWDDRRSTADDLSHEQREALQTAVEYGYYESPREVSLQEIATDEGIPVSTLQYRITRAEAWLAKRYLSGFAENPSESAASDEDANPENEVSISS